MKKIIALVLCVFMLVPCFTWVAFADEIKDEERVNVAPNGRTFHSSLWNSDRGSKYINNGVYSNSYQFWEPSSVARDESVDDSLQWFGMTFNDYYDFDQIKIFGRRYGHLNGIYCTYCQKAHTNVKEITDEKNAVCGACGNKADRISDENNNIKYTVEVLIQGQWIEAGHAYNDSSDYYAVNNEVVRVNGGAQGIITIKFDKVFPEYDENGDIKLNADGTQKLTNIATSRSFRVKCTEYGIYAQYEDGTRVWKAQQDSGDATYGYWFTPQVNEVEVPGRPAVNEPAFDVPEGAEVVTNAALGGMANATSVGNAKYPALGNDNVSNTYWKSKANAEGNQSFWIDFDNNYTITEVTLNFGGVEYDPSNGKDDTGIELAYDVYIKQDGDWMKYCSGTATTTSAAWSADQLKKHAIGQDIEGIKITFTSAKKNGATAQALLTELGAPISPDSENKQCVFLSSFMTTERRISTAQGNLACYGEAYCSSSFEYAGVSDVTYINDGKTTDSDYSWFAESFLRNSYCGVELKEAHTVSKVVLFFNDAVTEGKPEEHVMSFDIEALVNGEYVVIASATSYNADKKEPIVSINIATPVLTSDVRVVYKSNGMVFPYLKEIEIYEGEFVYGGYLGYTIADSSRYLYGRPLTQDFANKSVTPRSAFHERISPIEYFNIAWLFGVDPAWL